MREGLIAFMHDLAAEFSLALQCRSQAEEHLHIPTQTSARQFPRQPDKIYHESTSRVVTRTLASGYAARSSSVKTLAGVSATAHSSTMSNPTSPFRHSLQPHCLALREYSLEIPFLEHAALPFELGRKRLQPERPIYDLVSPFPPIRLS